MKQTKGALKIWLRRAAQATACLLALTASAAATGVRVPDVVHKPLALTPYMGLDTWYAFGTHINEGAIVGLADSMVSTGLKAVGYRYLWIDAGWWTGARDPRGNIVLSPSQWPHGMNWLTDYVHARGLLIGIYTDAGAKGCAEARAGSYGHYQADVDAFGRWGFDAVKVDFCGGNAMRLNPRTAYRHFGQAILADSPRRPMLFSVCDGATPSEYAPGVPAYDQSAYAAYRFAPATANSWRTGGDIGRPGEVGFTGMLRNLDYDSMHPAAAGPGRWNDPDAVVPGAGMTPAEARAQFTMWVILMLSEDIRAMPTWIRTTVTDRAALAIDQDRLGIQGQVVSRHGGAQVWVKPLANGDRAVAVLNRGPTPASLRITAASLGLLKGSPLKIYDIWARATTIAPGAIDRTIPAHGALLLRVSGADSHL